MSFQTERQAKIRSLRIHLIPSARHAVINARDEESKLHYQKTLIERLNRLAKLEEEEIKSLKTKVENL